MQFKKTDLPNGVRVVTVPMLGNPTVTVMISVATGSLYETPEQSGISHFLEHVCFKGTKKRPTPRQITTDLDSVGAVYNAFTSKDITGYWAKADVKHFGVIAEIVTDIFKNSTFPEIEIEKEKGVVMGEIDMYADDPQEKIGEAILKHMYKGFPAERAILGTKETVKAITREDIMTYRTSQYTGPNVVVTIAGGVKEEEMISFARENFSDLSNQSAKPEFPTADREQSGPETVFIDKDTDQAHIVMAWRSMTRTNPDRHVARLIRNILRGGLSSRLFIKLREEMGSGYYISADNVSHESHGFFSISTGTTPERVAEVVSAVLEVVELLRNEPVPLSELRKVKEFMRSHRLMSLETSDDVAGYTSEQEVFDKNIMTPEEFEAIFAKITPDDVMRVAKVIFDRKKLTVAMIGKGIDKEAVYKAIS